MYKILNVANKLYLAADEFGNIVSSQSPYNWLFYENPKGTFRIKSENNNLFMQTNEDSKVILVDDALDQSANTNPLINLALQKFNLQRGLNGYVIVSSSNKRAALAMTRNQEIVVALYNNRFDRGIDFKTFIIEEVKAK